MKLLIVTCILLIATVMGFRSRFPTKTQLSSRTSLGMGVKITLNDDEPVENVLKKFKRAVNQSGHLMELRNKEQWETAAEKKKRKAAKARLLNRIERTNDRYENRSYGASEYNS
mmetsp:Transcript_2415/g.3785  ORF Transcript_2415/g.3785 Transcript_2415/m.3785 type:complete len:114 (+) Transcript_2415:84-425(+)|eukprot:CAMPEP_0174968860 /NCGR_PEP_ID=MMETSP0004_2-20121128/8395_1 /TAXON_ID=420556 /ORGANISM="Ochromonas sp., Strain CCMP1393" /LENGTH=113 /DNA_ID=CAMNT_0016218193 /DNA_START=107 /DNA_END=448 /DNA_ORIENTATION=+